MAAITPGIRALYYQWEQQSALSLCQGDNTPTPNSVKQPLGFSSNGKDSKIKNLVFCMPHWGVRQPIRSKYWGRQSCLFSSTLFGGRASFSDWETICCVPWWITNSEICSSEAAGALVWNFKTGLWFFRGINSLVQLRHNCSFSFLKNRTICFHNLLLPLSTTIMYSTSILPPQDVPRAGGLKKGSSRQFIFTYWALKLGFMNNHRAGLNDVWLNRATNLWCSFWTEIQSSDRLAMGYWLIWAKLTKSDDYKIAS